MKQIIILNFLLLSFVGVGQQYQLIGDSCMRCDYSHNFGGTTFYPLEYTFFPKDTIHINNHVYSAINNTFPDDFIGIRQEQNKLYGLKYYDEYFEHLIMDFDALPGDTLFNLYTNGVLYNAKVDSLDSILRNDGTYHHFMKLTGYEFISAYGTGPNNWQSHGEWEITWNEMGLCNFNQSWDEYNHGMGGYTFNIPSWYHSSNPSFGGQWCTPDPRYSDFLFYTCQNCYNYLSTDELNGSIVKIYPNPAQSEITVEFASNEKRTLRIINLQGSLLKTEVVNLQKHTLDLQGLAGGLYILEVTGENSKTSTSYFVCDN